MKKDELLYLTAREAAAELSVSSATLYAYVSRGLIRSEPAADSRSKRYRADDVRALRNRRTPISGARGATEGPVLESSISTITTQGPLYRGVLAVDLAQQASLEEAATLLWNTNEANPFSAANMPPETEPLQSIRDALKAQPPIVRAIALASLASEADPRAFNRSPKGRAETGARVMRLICGAVLRKPASSQPIHQQIAESWCPGDSRAEDVIRHALVLTAEHELNASAYTVRCAVSTGINLYDAVIAGLAAVKGPRHGGAGALAARLVQSLDKGDMAAQIRERTALGEAFPGFGHLVYENGDPRANSLLQALTKAGADPRLCIEAPKLVREATGLFPTIDYALAVMIRTLGLPIGHEMPVFAIARTAGWIAHAIEQQEQGQIIRPRARYIGPAPGRLQIAEMI